MFSMYVLIKIRFQLSRAKVKMAIFRQMLLAFLFFHLWTYFDITYTNIAYSNILEKFVFHHHLGVVGWCEVAG